MLLNEFNKYKDKTEKTLRKLNYTHMKDVILNNFDKDIPDILIDLSKICA